MLAGSWPYFLDDGFSGSFTNHFYDLNYTSFETLTLIPSLSRMKSLCFILWPLVPTVSDLADNTRNQSTDSQNSKAFHDSLSA